MFIVEMDVFHHCGAPWQYSNSHYDKQSYFGCLRTFSTAFISQIAILHVSVLLHLWIKAKAKIMMMY